MKCSAGVEGCGILFDEHAHATPTEVPTEELHELRCLLYEAGWNSVGKPQDFLRRKLQRISDLEAALATIRAEAEARGAREEREAVVSYFRSDERAQDYHEALTLYAGLIAAGDHREGR